ncbi:MAG: flagellar brake protein [Fimbriimonadales bacterium]|nr:flagellar brake protein [Fimbriimonadales bacterium]
MTEGALLGVGCVVALVGGFVITPMSRRWKLCPCAACPALEVGQRVELSVAGVRYATLLSGTEGETLLLVPPLRRGLPVSFEAGTSAQIRLTTPAGVYEATVQFTGRQVQPTPLLHARLVRRWSHLQRRRHERIPLPDEVNVSIRIAGEPWVGWARDVSVGGIRLIAPAPAPLNAQVMLELPRALRGIMETERSERVARVVACERAPTRYGYAYQLRLAFTDV